MAENDKVNSAITDAVTQSNVAVVSGSPALAVAQSYLSASQANSVLFANLVAEQQRLAVAGQAATVSGVTKTIGACGARSLSKVGFAEILRQVDARAQDLMKGLETNSNNIQDILGRMEAVQQQIKGKVDNPFGGAGG